MLVVFLSVVQLDWETPAGGETQAFTVTLRENVPGVDVSSLVTGPSPITLVPFNSLNWIYPNHVFVDWSESQNGGGATFDDQAQIPLTESIVLFAQWTQSYHSVVFYENRTPSDTTHQIETANEMAPLLLESTMNFANPHFSFIGWSTTSDGTGTMYVDGATYNFLSDLTLYAQWKPEIQIIQFKLEGGKGRVANLEVPYLKVFALPSSAGIVRVGYKLAGWREDDAAHAPLVSPGGSSTATSNATYLAVWKPNRRVALEYSDNGASGHVRASTALAGQSVKVRGGGMLHRAGYVFKGWATSPRAKTPNIVIGENMVLTKTKTLYALWRKVPPANTPQQLLGSVGEFAPNSSQLTPSMRGYIASVASKIAHQDTTKVYLYGYATSADAAKGSALLSLQRALAVEKALTSDLARLNDVGVTIVAKGQGRLTNSVLSSFRKVELFAN